MGRKFEIPLFYRSSVISSIKKARRGADHRKKDISPTTIDLGTVRFKIARHFGFCFGVENAIDIAYRAIKENPDKRIFLLSEMIHNPTVNNDLLERGVKYLFSQSGEELYSIENLHPEDIVIVPAFGTTVSLFQRLSEKGINPLLYNATCPFVEKVWRRSEQLGEAGFTVIIHGKHYHEETKATFSHSELKAPSLVIRDLREAEIVANFIRNRINSDTFMEHFRQRVSKDFDPDSHLVRFGIVNQTTMLARDTQVISNLLRQALIDRYGDENIDHHFADTRDTLCYATNENQDAIQGLIDSGGDLAIVVGGYNSSNTSHLAQLLSAAVPTYYIKDADEILNRNTIRHLDIASREVITSNKWLPETPPRAKPLDILISAGASCPDVIVDDVLEKVATFLGVAGNFEQASFM